MGLGFASSTSLRSHQGGPGEAAGCVGPLQLQRLGSSTTFQERSQMLEKLHPAGTQQARHTRTWKRDLLPPMSLQHPL